MMTAFLNQQKENIGGNQGLHYAGLPRPQPQTPAMLNILFSPPSNIPAPVPVKPVVVKIENSQTPPPQLMAETSIGELEQCVSALAGVSVLADLRQEIVILLTNISEKLTSCSKEDLMLVMGQLKAMISHITGPRHL
uniref:Phosphoprotein n=1 Tax=Heterorhabditis bacteriophora TaxID=37862 RepID=A0A1I7X8L8_HETBA